MIQLNGDPNSMNEYGNERHDIQKMFNDCEFDCRVIDIWIHINYNIVYARRFIIQLIISKYKLEITYEFQH